MHSVVVFTPKSDQSRRGGKWIHLGRLKLADELASLRVPDSDVRVIARPTYEEFSVKWIPWPVNTHLIVKDETGQCRDFMNNDMKTTVKPLGVTSS